MPEDEGYRKAVESFTRQRLQVCREEEDWEVIEKRLGCGQVEELIEEARERTNQKPQFCSSFLR